ERSSTVDSNPTPVVPPSIIISILPERSALTWSAAVGLGFPEVFAEGAAIVVLLLLISSKAIGWSGILIATVSKPPDITSGTISLFLNIIVKGPGQNRFIHSIAMDGISSVNRFTCAISYI